MKLAKVSLAAVVALGALSTASMAKDLSEAIKGVDVSGYMRYRFNQETIDNNGYVNDADTAGTQGSGTDQHEWKGTMIFKVPTSEQFTAVVGLEYNNRTGTDASDSQKYALGRGTYVNAPGTGTSSDNEEGVGVRQYYGVWTPNGTKTTVQVGKFALATPATDGGYDRATGILALNSDVENVTFAAAALDNWYSKGTDGLPVYGNNGVGGSGGSFTPGTTTVGSGAIVGYDASGNPIYASTTTTTNTPAPTGTTNGSFHKPIYAIAAIGGYEGLSAQLWYFNITDMVDALWVADLAYKMDMSDDMGFGIAGQYYDNSLASGTDSLASLFNPSASTKLINDDYALYTVELRGHFSIVDARLGYNGSDKKGYFVQLTNEGTGVNYGGEKLLGDYSWTPGASYTKNAIAGATQDGKNELSAWYAAVMANTGWNNTAVGVDYVNAEWKRRNAVADGIMTTGLEAVDANYKVKGEEWVLRAEWKPVDAWKIKTYYSMRTYKNDYLKDNPAAIAGGTYKDQNIDYWRVEAKYSF